MHGPSESGKEAEIVDFELMGGKCRRFAKELGNWFEFEFVD